MWKVEKIIKKGDYNYALVHSHPNSTEYGYVLHHRIVVENHLGRLLKPHEVVHHINGDKKDNHIENLELMRSSEHCRLHAMEVGKEMVVLKCPNCGEAFERRKGQTHLQKSSSFTACSKSCRGSLSSHIQHHGITQEVKEAISENVIKEYRKYPNDNSEVTDDNQEP